MTPGNYFREYEKKKMHIEEKCLKGTKLILAWVRDYILLEKAFCRNFVLF